MIRKIDHVGIAVKDLDASIELYRDRLGLKLLGREIVPDGTVEVAFFECGDSKIELFMPVNNPGVTKFLETRGEGIHHICLDSSNVQADLGQISAKGGALLDKTPRPGGHGKQVAFIHPKALSGVLIELSQDGPGAEAHR